MKTEFGTFYLSFGPGFERVAHLELVKSWATHSSQFFLPPFPEVEFFRGGIEFKAPAEIIPILKSELKIPQKILCRKFSAPAEDFNDLEVLLKKYILENKLKSTQLHFSSRSSFINNEKSVIKVLSKLGVKVNKDAENSIYIRLFRDELTLSQDLTPKGLYKRGLRTHVGIAPLRENIASAVLQWALMGPGDGAWTVFDPMLGSGVFLLEAQLINKNLSTQENHVVEGQPRITHFIGTEKDNKTFLAAQKNLDFNNVNLINQDFFKLNPSEVTFETDKKLMIGNLPYGERLKVKIEFYDDFLIKAAQFKCDRICVLVPDKVNFLPVPEYELVRTLPFSNGGIPVKALLFQLVPSYLG